MSIAPKTNPEYMFLLRGTQLETRLSLPEMQEAMSHYRAWLDRLTKEGKLKGGQPLAPSGRIISGKLDRTVSDGPFAEAKEAIGGYLMFNVPDLDSAVAIAQTCPLLDYGADVEVRPVLELCPTMQRLNECQLKF
jgi:hypothetical protein